MYGYIMLDNIVGQTFDEMPPVDMYHPDFLSRIVALTEGVSSGWVYDPATGVFAPPWPEPAPEPTIEETLLELAADWEYRLCMIELGLN